MSTSINVHIGKIPPMCHSLLSVLAASSVHVSPSVCVSGTCDCQIESGTLNCHGWQFSILCVCINLLTIHHLSLGHTHRHSVCSNSIWSVLIWIFFLAPLCLSCPNPILIPDIGSLSAKKNNIRLYWTHLKSLIKTLQ